MTNLLLASQCPAPQLRSSFLSISAASTLANAPVSSRYVQGETATVLGKLNANSTRQDLVGSYGGGAYFVAQGLKITAGIGLTISVAPGTAMIDGPVNLETATTLAVPANAGPIFIWLEQNGSLAYTVNLAPPAAASCLLGNITTSASAVTATDTSGVLYGSGILQRTTADAGMPTDTPPAGLHFYTVTAGGTYYWNGTAYANIAGKNGTNGAAATVSVGSVSTGAAGSQASVTNSGTSSAAVLNFLIPQGAAGSGGSGVSSVTNADSTLVLGGTSSAPTLAVNLGNANTWTAPITLGATGSVGRLNFFGNGNAGGSQASAGVSLLLNYNQPGNTQLVIGPSAGVGSSSTWFFRTGFQPTGAVLDCISGDGATFGTMYFGANNAGSNCCFGTGTLFTSTAKNTFGTISSQTAVQIIAASGQTMPYLQGVNSSGAQTWAVDQNANASFAGLTVAGVPVIASQTVSLAASTQNFSAAGKNYLVNANFSGSGSFSDALYETLLTASNASFTVSPNQNGQTAGVMSWIVYVPTGQTSLSSISLTASLRGRGWTGSTAVNVAATWTVTQIA